VDSPLYDDWCDQSLSPLSPMITRHNFVLINTRSLCPQRACRRLSSRLRRARHRRVGAWRRASHRRSNGRSCCGRSRGRRLPGGRARAAGGQTRRAGRGAARAARVRGRGAEAAGAGAAPFRRSERVCLVFLLVPVDARLRCREVCRGWCALLTEAPLWRVCDVSVRSGTAGAAHARAGHAGGARRGWLSWPVKKSVYGRRRREQGGVHPALRRSCRSSIPTLDRLSSCAPGNVLNLPWSTICAWKTSRRCSLLLCSFAC